MLGLSTKKVIRYKNSECSTLPVKTEGVVKNVVTDKTSNSNHMLDN